MRTAEEKIILRVYAALSASLLLMLVPVVIFAVIAPLLFIGATIAAATIRRRADAQSLIAGHMSFILRTIGIGTLLAVPTTAVAAAYMLSRADSSPLQPCADAMASQIMDGATDMQAVSRLMEPCVGTYITTNMPVIGLSILIAGSVPLVYFAYRLAKGLNRARQGHRIEAGWL